MSPVNWRSRRANPIWSASGQLERRLVSQARRAARNRLIVRRPWAVSRMTSVVEQLLIYGERMLGQVSHPQARPAHVQHIQDGQAGLIGIDACLGEQELMQPGLLERASQRVQRRLDLADRLAGHGLGGSGR